MLLLRRLGARRTSIVINSNMNNKVNRNTFTTHPDTWTQQYTDSQADRDRLRGDTCTCVRQADSQTDTEHSMTRRGWSTTRNSHPIYISSRVDSFIHVDTGCRATDDYLRTFGRSFCFAGRYGFPSPRRPCRTFGVLPSRP